MDHKSSFSECCLCGRITSVCRSRMIVSISMKLFRARLPAGGLSACLAEDGPRLRNHFIVSASFPARPEGDEQSHLGDSNPRPMLYEPNRCGGRESSQAIAKPVSYEKRQKSSQGALAPCLRASTQTCPDLQAVIDAWPTLPNLMRHGILAMVRAVTNG